MLNNKIAIVLLVLLAALQLYVPASMILEREQVLSTGKVYKFKTAPVDPYDPFRGKYVTLEFEVNRVKVADNKEWQRGETVYVLLSSDSNGFARVVAAQKNKPAGNAEFVKAKVRYDAYNQEIEIDYPFNRYYMEESKAPEAERVYQQRNVDSSQVTYALVNIRNGEAVLKDVMINNVSIHEVIKNNPALK